MYTKNKVICLENGMNIMVYVNNHAETETEYWIRLLSLVSATIPNYAPVN